MNPHRFLNQSQPQTLVNATLLCYFEAVFALLDGFGYAPLMIIAVGLGAGGYGIANEFKWGYTVAAGAGILNAALWVYFYRIDVLGFPQVVSFAFAIVLVVLVLHPTSRDYQRIWFK